MVDNVLSLIHIYIPLKAHVHRVDDIFTAIRIAKEFGIKMTMDHCSEGHLVAEELAKEGFPAIVGPDLTSRNKIEMCIRDSLKGAPVKGVGPQDVALAIIGAVFKNGYVKNKVMEFVGPGVASLSADFPVRDQMCIRDRYPPYWSWHCRYA